MDRRKYIAEVVKKTGIRLDENDPVFAVVLLNQLILEEQKSELEILVEQLSSTGKAINGEVVKQAQTLWDSKTRQLNAEAAELKMALLREHSHLQKGAREAVTQAVNDAVVNLTSSMTDNNRSNWTATIVGGLVGGLVVALVSFLMQ